MNATAKLSEVITHLLHEAHMEERSALLTLEWVDYDKAPSLPMHPDRPASDATWTPRQVRVTYRRSGKSRPWYVSAEVRGLDTGLGQPVRSWSSLQTMPGWLVDIAKLHAPGGELA